MSKSPTAALSANLVAIKGTAVPTLDMTTRAAAPVASAALSDVPIRPAGDEQGAEAKESNLTPLNFRIPASFRREFKTYAAKHDLKLNELLRRCFEAYRRAQGD